jgi:hypothetical protein
VVRRQSSFDMEIIKRTATWAEQIVRADPEWQDYSGVGPYGEKLAIVDVCLKYVVGDDPTLKPLLELYRNYLLQMRKQYFGGTLANQITMLALLKGSKRREISAVERIMSTETEDQLET